MANGPCDVKEITWKANLRTPTLETTNPTTPAKSRRVEGQNGARQERPLRSPEDRLRNRRSPLDAALPDYSQDDNDPFVSEALAGPSAPAYSLPTRNEEGEIVTGPEEEQGTPQAQLLGLPPHQHERGISSEPPSPPPSDISMDDIDYEELVYAADFGTRVPAHRDENPHRPYPAFTPTGPTDHAMVSFQKHAGGGAGLVMSHNTAMTNVSPRVVEHIADNKDTHIIFWQFLGGKHAHLTYRNAAADLTKELEPITGKGGIAIVAPTPHETRGDWAGNPLFFPPWVLVGECKTKDIRDEVARHKLIGVNRDLAVHVTTVDMERMSWTMGHWRDNMNGAVAPSTLREAAATQTFSQGPLRTAVAHATQNQEGSADKRVYEFVNSLDVLFTHNDKEATWVLYAKPCTTSHAVWEGIRDIFRNTKFATGLTEFIPIGSASRATGSNIRRLALCYLCKLDDHRSDSCPYTYLPDWLGPNELLKEGREGVLALRRQPNRNRDSGNGSDNTDSRAGDGGCKASGSYLEDRPRLVGGVTAGGSEDHPTRDEPLRASGTSGSSDDELTATTSARGRIPDAEELQAPHGLMQCSPVRMDNSAASAFHAASVMASPPQGMEPAQLAEAAASALSTASARAYTKTEERCYPQWMHRMHQTMIFLHS
ncbi:hypothetical protein C8R45DRAFT_931687 [Mycena sanguinolenta]|nr:hypothetical protein C8R45DRAFT_931687 [Mycena sanguinolenta]